MKLEKPLTRETKAKDIVLLLSINCMLWNSKPHQCRVLGQKDDMALFWFPENSVKKLLLNSFEYSKIEAWEKTLPSYFSILFIVSNFWRGIKSYFHLKKKGSTIIEVREGQTELCSHLMVSCRHLRQPLSKRCYWMLLIMPQTEF